MSHVTIEIRDDQGRRSARRRFDRILDVCAKLAEGFHIMTAAQDRFEASLKAYREASDAKTADLQKQIDDLKAAPATSDTNKAFNDAADELDKAAKDLKGSADVSTGSLTGNAGSGGSSLSQAPSSSSPSSTGATSDSAGFTNYPAPGGSPADALSSGASGTGTPTPITSVP